MAKRIEIDRELVDALDSLEKACENRKLKLFWQDGFCYIYDSESASMRGQMIGFNSKELYKAYTNIVKF